ncbi:MAG: hypothetical protein K0S37_4829 [Microbacterium sp.]|nr:hypothetical protein [Microbacterium sp.]
MRGTRRYGATWSCSQSPVRTHAPRVPKPDRTDTAATRRRRAPNRAGVNSADRCPDWSVLAGLSVLASRSDSGEKCPKRCLRAQRSLPLSRSTPAEKPMRRRGASLFGLIQRLLARSPARGLHLVRRCPPRRRRRGSPALAGRPPAASRRGSPARPRPVPGTPRMTER